MLVLKHGVGGLGFRVWGVSFWGLGLGVYIGFRVFEFGFRVWGLRFGVPLSPKP